MTSVLQVINEMHDYISNQSGICDVKTNMQLPVDRLSISEWEKKFNCSMPLDLLNFYLVSNGLNVSWKVKCGDLKCSVGRININSLNNLTCVVGSSSPLEEKISFADLVVTIDDDSDSKTKIKVPNLVNQYCRLFHLEDCDHGANVLLVYFETPSGILSKSPEVWLLDRSFRFYKLTNTFSEYFRLVIMYFGLPQWQFLFTDYGPTPQAKQFIHMYASPRFSISSEINRKQKSINSNSVSSKKPNFEKIFRVPDSNPTDKVVKATTSAKAASSKN